MIARQVIEKSQGAILIGYGACGVSARAIERGSGEFEALTGAYETVQEHTVEMRDRFDNASNMISRFFAKRRYDQALAQEAKSLVHSEIDDKLMQIRFKDSNG